MRVALVLDDTLDTPDGVQQYVLGIGSWLHEQGHEVHYLVGHTTRTDIPNLHSLSRNLKVRFNGNRMSIPLPASRRAIRQVLQRYDFDVVHVQVPYSPFLGGRVIGATSPHTAVLGTFHILPYSWPVRVANRLLAASTIRSSKRFDSMLAVSPPARDFASHTYGFTNIQVVPNPVRLAQFTGGHITQDKHLTIIFLGRLVERKGAHYLLTAIAKLHDQGILPANARVRIGGKGPLEPALRAYVQAHGLSGIVDFAGFIDETNKAAFLQEADIAVFPSVSGESFGIVLLEAMAAARGVVLGGDNPGYRSVLHGLSERLCDPRDSIAFAALLERWIHTPADRKAAATEQHQYVQQFDITVVGRKIVSAYTQALQKRRSA